VMPLYGSSTHLVGIQSNPFMLWLMIGVLGRFIPL
jgi:hypothetical protein